ncbi:MAG: hypothetical protein CML56_10375 [Rhodobacteraceae bacterium]|nr:hypothetical protein [Paracoccaceae bacterium]|tara:strand:+ start:401 stop:655 length:255 start_codon:yes stop_codon:yes gene_type:complete
MKILQTGAILISLIFIGGSAYAGCAATAGFDKAMGEYNLAELSQSMQDDISELSKDCKDVLHTGKAMSSIGSCTEALEIAKGNS